MQANATAQRRRDFVNSANGRPILSARVLQPPEHEFSNTTMSAAVGTPTAAEYGPAAGIIAPLPAAERGVAVPLGVSPDGEFLAYGNQTNVIVRSVKVRPDT